MVMIKPALAYLDVISRVRQAFNCPLAAYNVSGEFAMVKAAAQRGWIDERQAILEILTGIKAFPEHTDGILYSCLIIYHIVLGQYMNDFLSGLNGDFIHFGKDPFGIFLCNFLFV